MEDFNSKQLSEEVYAIHCMFHVYSCWLSSAKGSHAIWTFVAPMLLIILVRMTTASLYIPVILTLHVLYIHQDQCSVSGACSEEYFYK